MSDCMPASSYTIEINQKLQAMLEQADTLKSRLETAKEKNPGLWPTILKKLEIDWTYHSNAIEGSTLSRGETHFFLTEGLTVEGRPLKDFLDAKNHAQALGFMYDIATNKRPITEGLIKEINALLLFGIEYTPAQTLAGQSVKKKASPGQYKTQPNHVLKTDGTIHQYTDPLQVPGEMEFLMQWFSKAKSQNHPVCVASILHYNLVRIHPFDDGNGRGSRILMNLFLIQQGYFPILIKRENKRHYLKALEQSNQGDTLPFIHYITKELIETYQGVIADLE